MTTQTARAVAGVAPGLLLVRSGLAARMRVRAAGRQHATRRARTAAVLCLPAGCALLALGVAGAAPNVPWTPVLLLALLATYAAVSLLVDPRT